MLNAAASSSPSSGRAALPTSTSYGSLSAVPSPAVAAASVSRFASIVSGLDARIHDAADGWKRAVWEYTLTSTRFEELADASAALMAQLVNLLEQGEEERRELCALLWHAVVEEWVERHEAAAARRRRRAGGGGGVHGRGGGGLGVVHHKALLQ